MIFRALYNHVRTALERFAKESYTTFIQQGTAERIGEAIDYSIRDYNYPGIRSSKTNVLEELYTDNTRVWVASTVFERTDKTVFLIKAELALVRSAGEQNPVPYFYQDRSVLPRFVELEDFINKVVPGIVYEAHSDPQMSLTGVVESVPTRILNAAPGKFEGDLLISVVAEPKRNGMCYRVGITDRETDFGYTYAPVFNSSAGNPVVINPTPPLEEPVILPLSNYDKVTREFNELRAKLLVTQCVDILIQQFHERGGLFNQNDQTDMENVVGAELLRVVPEMSWSVSVLTDGDSTIVSVTNRANTIQVQREAKTELIITDAEDD